MDDVRDSSLKSAVSILPDSIKLTQAEIDETKERIRNRLSRSVQDICETGEDLLFIKASLKHGKFRHWVEAELPFTIRTAQKYMAIHECFHDKSEVASLLSPETAYALAAPSTSKEVAAVLIDRIRGGEKITEKDVKAARKKTPEDDDARTADPVVTGADEIQPPCSENPLDVEPKLLREAFKAACLVFMDTAGETDFFSVIREVLPDRKILVTLASPPSNDAEASDNDSLKNPEYSDRSPVHG